MLVEDVPRWSNRIFRRRPRDVGGGRPRDVLETNICRPDIFFKWWKSSVKKKIYGESCLVSGLKCWNQNWKVPGSKSH